MTPEVLTKSEAERTGATLVDYAVETQGFRWDAARQALTGLPDGRGLNIAHEAVDRRVGTPGSRGTAGPFGDLGARAALRWCGKGANVREITYSDLKASSNQLANALSELGVGAGDRVFGLLPRVPELYAAILGTLKVKAVFSPLFPAFGPEPVKARMTIGEGKVLFTTTTLYKRKILPIRGDLPALERVILIDDASSAADPALALALAGTLRLAELTAKASSDFTIPPTSPEDMALLHFTSGTTGTPKGAIHVHDAVVAHHVTGRFALDLRPGDVFWCTADPGWVTGMSYGVIAPLTNGATLVVDEGDFDAERWYGILEQQKVNVWYTAPTAVRMLMKAGTALARRFDLSALRLIASVGEPLNPEAVRWGMEAFGRAIHDNWWQTETGGIMISNFRSMDVRPGSMGKPLPGIEAVIATRTEAGEVEIVTTPDTQGELALRVGWPSMFRGYLKNDERYRKCFADRYYFTGDLAKRDRDGYFWFVGRADDVIKSAGHLIGPFEVESALMEHPAVAEAGVIGKPDPLLLEVVKAFVALKAGFAPTDALQKELLAFARRRLGPAVAPREITVVDGLPKTKSGKILRRLLKARELGLPEGDLSTLENPNS